MTDPAADASEAEKQRRREALAGVLIVVSVVGFVVFRRVGRALATPASEAQCLQLVHHYVEKASQQHQPTASKREIIEAQQQARLEPAGIGDVQSCQRDLTSAQAECGLASPNIDDFERCMQ